MRFSSGTIPLMAVTRNLSLRRTFSFFRWPFRYGEGVTNTSVWQFFTTSLMSEEKVIRFTSKCTLVRYAGLCPRRLKSSMRSSRRRYHHILSFLSSNILAMAVAQLPPPITAIVPIILILPSMSRGAMCAPRGKIMRYLVSSLACWLADALFSGFIWGKNNTSWMKGFPVMSITRRSMPMPIPLVGGIPY